MAKEKTVKKKAVEDEVLPPLDESTRFRYIGFGVFSESKQDFFKTEAEKKEHEKAVVEYRKQHFSPFRGFSAVNQPILSNFEKSVLTISSVLMVISAFLPWMSFKSNWVSLKFIGLLGFFQASPYMNTISLFNPTLKWFLYIPALLSLVAFVFGILTLIVLYSPAKDFAAYLARLKRMTSLQYFPLALWFLFFVILIIGINLPFGDWMAENYGVRGIGSSVNIITFVTLAGIGVWISLAGLVVNSIKSNDL